MHARSSKSISSRDLEDFLKGRGLTIKRTLGDHMVVSGSQGAVVVIVDREIGVGLATKIRRGFVLSGTLTANEYDRFIAEHSPGLVPALQQPIDISRTISRYDYVRDPVLKRRLSNLDSSPLDTVIREAGVVLEDRLRKKGNQVSADTLHGVALVDALLAPGKGTIVFSANPAEQDGARMLYRGAMQFIRNPAMHKLVEYTQTEAHLYIGMIDSLLQLLSEVNKRSI